MKVKFKNIKNINKIKELLFAEGEYYRNIESKFGFYDCHPSDGFGWIASSGSASAFFPKTATMIYHGSRGSLLSSGHSVAIPYLREANYEYISTHRPDLHPLEAAHGKIAPNQWSKVLSSLKHDEKLTLTHPKGFSVAVDFGHSYEQAKMWSDNPQHANHPFAYIGEGECYKYSDALFMGKSLVVNKLEMLKFVRSLLKGAYNA